MGLGRGSGVEEGGGLNDMNRERTLDWSRKKNGWYGSL